MDDDKNDDDKNDDEDKNNDVVVDDEQSLSIFILMSNVNYAYQYILFILQMK